MAFRPEAGAPLQFLADFINAGAGGPAMLVDRSNEIFKRCGSHMAVTTFKRTI